MKRRQFIVSLAGTAALGGLAAWRQSSTTGGQPLESPFKGSTYALGTDVHLTLYHPSQSAAEKAIQAAFKELDRVESIMSLYREDSEICRLNRYSHLDSPHPWLREVLLTCARLSAKTKGAFDITIQPLYKAHAEAASSNRIIRKDELNGLLKKVGWNRVAVEKNRIRLAGEGTQISLNGIAQGFAADRVAAVLFDHGITNALIDTGEIGAVGTPPPRDAWQIGIKHPRRENALLAATQLHGRCLATSGDYETRFGDGFEKHHLIDPKTGQSANDLASVSVVTKSAMEADGLSTALFVMGLEGAQNLIAQLPDAEALLVTKQGRVIPTNGFPLRG